MTQQDKVQQEILSESLAAAAEAGLRYSQDHGPGIQRIRSGKGFRYLGPHRQAIKEEKVLQRIQALAIPPAWTEVWICPSPQGHLQATGRDAKGRKQYRYHERWKQVRDESKYNRMIAFGKALPRIRRRVQRDMKRPGLPRDKVLATIVRLLETTLIRVGNEEYARQNGSFGLTTMRSRHARIHRDELRFEFTGKSGVRHSITVHDRRLARIVKQCQEIPGQELFQYLDENGQRHSIESADVNAYLRSAAGDHYTAKDFRTWAGTVLAAQALQEFQNVTSVSQAKRNIVRAIETVAERLGNTYSVCRQCYVHPAVFDAYLDGTLLETLNQRVEGEIAHSLNKMSGEEAAVLILLRMRLQQKAREHR